MHYDSGVKVNLCRYAGNHFVGIVDLRRECLALDRWSELLNDELDTKVLHVNFARRVGQVNGSGFAPVVHEMPEMRF